MCLVTYATVAGRYNVIETLREYEFPVPNHLIPEWIRVLTGEAPEFAKEIPALQPDILGELFVLERLAGGYGADSNAILPSTNTRRLLDIALAHSGHNTADFVTRCLQDFEGHPSLRQLSALSIPEPRYSYGYLEDYLVRFGRIATVMANTSRHDLAEAAYSEMIEHGQKLLGGDELQDLVKRAMARLFYNRSVERAKLDKLDGSNEDLEIALRYVNAPVAETASWTIHTFEDATLWSAARVLRAKLKSLEGNTREAITDIELIIKHQAQLDTRAVAEAFVTRAELLRKMGDNAAARDACEQVLSMDATIDIEEQQEAARKVLFGILWDEAVAEERQGNVNKALALYNRLRALSEKIPEYRPFILVNRSKIFLEKGLHHECIKDCTEVIDNADAPIERIQKALGNRGHAYLFLRKILDASNDISSLEKTVVTPEDIWATTMILKARYMMAINKRAEARMTLKRS